MLGISKEMADTKKETEKFDQRRGGVGQKTVIPPPMTKKGTSLITQLLFWVAVSHYLVSCHHT